MINKKLVALAAATMVVGTLFVGCGEKQAEESSEGFTGVKIAEIAGESDTTIAEVTFENGTPVSVNIDTKNEDGSMKSEASASGAYDMKNDGKKWHEQIDLLEEAIVENNFDLSKINITDEDGHTDAVSGVSIKVKGYVDAVQEALDQVK
ncbi:FMN-binding protein [Clostridium sp. D43t1_170807_H7]|uniref:FMN-binding protein n=1 Tax=Clostridium sp. D43t1_170807_H7 TaxID=2787140 RepID=UPI00189B80D9|nr:FMN-binding protein [Clostridium sp. D43t1_170807_H7]